MKKEEFIENINAVGLGKKVFVKPTDYTGNPNCLGVFTMELNG